MQNGDNSQKYSLPKFKDCTDLNLATENSKYIKITDNAAVPYPKNEQSDEKK